ncbi:AraC-like ligand-binding domain-containing protein [Streptomyces sp. NPDC004726]
MTEFSTESVSPPDRFDCFAETTASWQVPNALRSDQADDFRARMRILDLGAFHVTSLSFPHLEIDRTPWHIRRTDTDNLQLHLLLQGTGAFTQNDAEIPMKPGQLVIVDTSLPSQGTITAAPGAPCSLVVFIPHRLLSLPRTTLKALTGAAIPLDSGIGAVTAHWLTDLVTHARQFRPSDVPALADATTELLTTLLDRHTAGHNAAPPEARPHALLAEIHDFIRRNLHNPALTPTAIAAVHHISTSHLHRLFRGRGPTVALTIRTQRLERLRRDLTDPHLHSHTISELATRNGFTSAAHAGRLFHRAYGTTPRDHRHHTPPHPDTGPDDDRNI